MTGGGQGAAASGPEGGLHILAVDEDATARTVLARRLRRHGHEVATAENGFVALAAMNRRRFDAILVDMSMTMLPGSAAITRMRGSGLIGNAALIAVTRRNDASAVIDAFRAGADDQVAKPFDIDVLDARIRHSVARARHLAELARFNEQLDARVARRAVELGEARAELADVAADRARLRASIQALHDQIERLSTARG